jgi:hypothetical protein
LKHRTVWTILTGRLESVAWIMRLRHLLFYWLVAGTLPAEETPFVATQKLPATATIRFQGSSTLHDFGGRVSTQPFALMLASNAWSASAGVLAGEMDTHNDGRDRAMWKMFETNSYPQVQGSVRRAPRPLPDGTKVTLALRIRDQEHDLEVILSRWKEDADSIRFHAEWDVSLTQFKLKPPSVAGVIRVGDKVHLAADVIAFKDGSRSNLPEAKPTTAPKP